MDEVPAKRAIEFQARDACLVDNEHGDRTHSKANEQERVVDGSIAVERQYGLRFPHAAAESVQAMATLRRDQNALCHLVADEFVGRLEQLMIAEVLFASIIPQED